MSQIIRHTAETLDVLGGLLTTVVAVDDEDEIARIVVTSLPTLLQCRTSALAFRETTTWRLMLQHAGQPWPTTHTEGLLAAVEHLFELAMHRGVLLLDRPTLSHASLAAESQKSPADVLMSVLAIHCLAAIPLHSLYHQVGLLLVGDANPSCISWQDVTLLQTLAKSLTITITNLRTWQKQRQYVRELETLIATHTAELQHSQAQYHATADDLATRTIPPEEKPSCLQDTIPMNPNFADIIGQSRLLRKMLRNVEAVAQTDTTVLLLGETGTGKELVARALHKLSARWHRTLVKVNCTAIPAGLIESELFGHEKGAFTGALSRRIGRFEVADGGTIFLDEVGDLPLDLQAKLLRVLQEMEFERLGSSRTIRVNVRIIAATNQDLERAVREGTFRADLYYRLYVFPIRLPSLRERQQDIPLLVRHFVAKYGAKLGRRINSIPQKTLDTLLAYPWPGNIRELENIIERAMILSPGAHLELGEWFPAPETPSHGGPIPTLEELERDHIVAVLELTNWRVSGEKGAARMLGMKPTTLEARMKKLAITRQAFPTYRDTPNILGRPAWPRGVLRML